MKKLAIVVLACVGWMGLLQAQSSTPKTTPAIPLTDGSVYCMAPTWAPDGEKLAVSTSKYLGIYIVSFPDGGMTQISEDPAAGFGMQWSHSGDKIASRIARFEEKKRYNAIAVFDAASGEKTLISEYQTLLPGTPIWTPDDQYVYLNGSENFKLYNVQSQQRVQSSAQSVPGYDLVYTKKSHIQRKTLSDNTEQNIQPVDGQVLNLTISPDQSKMAFEIMGGNLWVADFDGANPVDLGRGNAPSWSPDSQRLTYMVTEDDGYQFTSSDIYVINADGTGKVNISNTEERLEMHPDWSPDGNWIAYATLKSGQIFVQEVQ